MYIYIYIYMLVSPWILVDDFLKIHPFGTGSLVRGGVKKLRFQDGAFSCILWFMVDIPS